MQKRQPMANLLAFSSAAIQRVISKYPTVAATTSISTSSQMMAASLPPSSSVTRFKVPAHATMTFFPVSTEPVKLIFATSGCPVSIGPRFSSPLRAWNTPGGKTLVPNSASFNAEYGAYGDGFQMKVFPASRAASNFPIPKVRGKFHGTIPTPTPRGT